MAILTVPDSWGLLREFNQCHNPEGPGGGQFCSGVKTTSGSKIDFKLDPESPELHEHIRERMASMGMSEGVIERLSRQFSGDVKVTVALGGQTGALGVHIKDANGNVITHQFKQLTDGSVTAKIPLFTVDKKEQNKGLAKRVLRDTMDVYKRLKVTQVTLEANIDVGGYAWAKFGFTAMHPEDFRAQVLVHLLGQRGRMLEKAERQQIIDFAAQHKGPKLPWHIAALSVNGKKVGKTLMLGTGWDAVLDMTDPEALERFNSYVR